MSQTIILSSKKREKLIIIMQNKIEIMFKIHFSFLSIMFMKDVVKFDYFSLIDNETSMTHREIIKIIQIKYLKLIKLLTKRCDSSLALSLNKYIFF